MEKRQEKEKNSTVAIAPNVAKSLEKFCRKIGITKKEYIEISLAFFDRFGVNPKENESPAHEFVKIYRRFDQIVSFIKTAEKERINPMFEAVTATEARINIHLENIVSKEQLKRLTDALNQHTQAVGEKYSNGFDKLQQENKHIAQALFILAQSLEDGKDRKGLSDKMKNILGF